MEEPHKDRNSSIELLRIISMFLIILHHFSIHGIIKNATITLASAKYVNEILFLGGKIGVNIFILISAYFMIDKKITIKKILKIEGQVLFYSLGILILFLTILNPVEKIGFKAIISSIFPTVFELYWFSTTYIILMILSPFINKFIDAINEKEHKAIIVILLIMWSIIPSIVIFSTDSLLNFNGIGWFVLLYLISGYIKRYNVLKKITIKKLRIILVISIILFILSIIILNMFENIFNIEQIKNYKIYFYQMNGILPLIISVAVVLVALGKKFENKIINLISSTTFGIYLLHDNIFMRPYLWKKVIKCSNYTQTSEIVLVALLSSILIFIFCMIIELVRQHTFEKLWMYIANRIDDKIKEISEKICSRYS